jgi:hypothetical protein
MKPKFLNKTNLTLDMYKRGVVANYKIVHRFLRAFSTAYAIIMLTIAVSAFLYFDWVVCIPFLILGAGIIYWNGWGYKLGTKKSFMKFAKLHSSHYQVEMEYRFYEDRLEQETSKTELTVLYKDFDRVYVLDDIILITFDKKLIIMDKKSFVDENSDNVIEFMKEKDIKIVKSRLQ